MTTKRFTYSIWSQTITDHQTGERYYGNLLQLKEEDPNKDLQAYKDIEDKIRELLRTKR